MSLVPYLNGEILNDLTVLALASYFGGLVLLMGNSSLYRFLEGYGTFNVLRIFTSFEKRRFHRIKSEIYRLDEMYGTQGQSFSLESRRKRNHLMNQVNYRFPDREEFLLPTPFGNVIRSFETYSRVMYGFEYVDGWSRLLTVMPSEYRALIDDAKAQVDFWINSLILSLVLALQVAIFAPGRNLLESLLLLFVLFMVSYNCTNEAQRNAGRWGDYVKSAFDVYRLKLLDILGFPVPASREEERRTWAKYSQSIIYRLPELLPEKKSPEKQKSKSNTKKTRSSRHTKA